MHSLSLFEFRLATQIAPHPLSNQPRSSKHAYPEFFA